jgi:hypothetical protein
VASLATVGTSGEAIAIYEHVSVSTVKAPFPAIKPYATRGESVTSRRPPAAQRRRRPRRGVRSQARRHPLTSPWWALENPVAMPGLAR